MEPYSLYSALLLTTALGALNRSSELYREQVDIWRTQPMSLLFALWEWCRCGFILICRRFLHSNASSIIIWLKANPPSLHLSLLVFPASSTAAPCWMEIHLSILSKQLYPPPPRSTTCQQFAVHTHTQHCTLYRVVVWTLGIANLGLVTLGIVSLGIVSLGKVTLGIATHGIVSLGIVTLGRVTLWYSYPW